jgi:hypothetical protein
LPCVLVVLPSKPPQLFCKVHPERGALLFGALPSGFWAELGYATF